MSAFVLHTAIPQNDAKFLWTNCTCNAGRDRVSELSSPSRCRCVVYAACSVEICHVSCTTLASKLITNLLWLCYELLSTIIACTSLRNSGMERATPSSSDPEVLEATLLDEYVVDS